MNATMSPRYQMTIINDIGVRLFELYHTHENVERYLEKWHQEYGISGYGDNENFSIFKDFNQRINVEKTLDSIDGETLLKIAIDLGVETPDFIPCIPTFRNELKSSYEMACQTFDKAFKNVEEDPSLAIGLANSALESIIKEILKDSRIDAKWEERDTLTSLTKSICKAFKLGSDTLFPSETKHIANSLINCSKGIEDLRSDKTILHGKMDGNYIITDSIYAYFVVNAVSTIGLFFLNYYKAHYPPVANDVHIDLNDDDLPF